MKLRDYVVFQPMTHVWLEQGQQYFEVGTRGIESIVASGAGVVVTILPDSGTTSRSLLFTGPGVGGVQTEEDGKKWEAHFKAERARRVAEAKDRIDNPRPVYTELEVP